MQKASFAHAEKMRRTEGSTFNYFTTAEGKLVAVNTKNPKPQNPKTPCGGITNLCLDLWLFKFRLALQSCLSGTCGFVHRLVHFFYLFGRSRRYCSCKSSKSDHLLGSPSSSTPSGQFRLWATRKFLDRRHSSCFCHRSFQKTFQSQLIFHLHTKRNQKKMIAAWDCSPIASSSI